MAERYGSDFRLWLSSADFLQRLGDLLRVAGFEDVRLERQRIAVLGHVLRLFFAVFFWAGMATPSV